MWTISRATADSLRHGGGTIVQGPRRVFWSGGGGGGAKSIA